MVTLITPTCDQPTGFALCERWMARQTLPIASLQWIVVDDGEVPVKPTMGQTYIRRERDSSTTGAQSLCRNLLAALPHAKGEFVLIIEHDDLYMPNHVEATVRLLKRAGAGIAGDDRQRYYNVAHRCWRIYKNRGASLCQTGMRRAMLPAFETVIRKCLSAGVYGIDSLFWATVDPKVRVLEQLATVVGIKGLPGRKGLGVGHRDDVIRRWAVDPKMEVLQAWAGADAAVYADLEKLAVAV